MRGSIRTVQGRAVKAFHHQSRTPTARGRASQRSRGASTAARRSTGHDEAVQESRRLRKQFDILWGDRVPAWPVELNEILRALARKRIPFVLIGAHGIGGWTGRPRSTKDVDILVKSGRNYARACRRRL